MHEFMKARPSFAGMKGNNRGPKGIVPAELLEAEAMEAQPAESKVEDPPEKPAAMADVGKHSPRIEVKAAPNQMLDSPRDGKLPPLRPSQTHHSLVAADAETDGAAW